MARASLPMVSSSAASLAFDDALDREAGRACRLPHRPRA
jgi:hypothetical protein